MTLALPQLMPSVPEPLLLPFFAILAFVPTPSSVAPVQAGAVEEPVDKALAAQVYEHEFTPRIHILKGQVLGVRLHWGVLGRQTDKSIMVTGEA